MSKKEVWALCLLITSAFIFFVNTILAFYTHWIISLAVSLSAAGIACIGFYLITKTDLWKIK